MNLKKEQSRKVYQDKRDFYVEKKQKALKESASTSAAGTSAGREEIAKRATAKTLGTGDLKSEGGDSEDRVEEERESDKQFDTTSGLLEKIYDEALTTNELLGKEMKDNKGLFSGLSDSLLPLAEL